MGEYAVKRWILTGTPITQGPFDIYAQFQFLDKSIFPMTYHCFKHRYGVFKKIRVNVLGPTGKVVLERDGTPKKRIVELVESYRNMDELVSIIQKHSFIVKKADCLDLPPKVFRTDTVDMSKPQLGLYKEVAEKLRAAIFEGMEITNVLTKLAKLQQITSGFLMHEDEVQYLKSGNPKLTRLRGILDEGTDKVIIWIKFKAEAALLKGFFEKEASSVVYYVGATSTDDRKAAIDRFQNDTTCKYFIANPRSAGYGLTLTKATTVIYFSNSFSLEDRLQSEDRAHRIGQTSPVLYIDLVCRNSIDEKITAALARKQKVSELVRSADFVNELLEV
jgi:SNF2 family DNA or RNA helicase